MKTAQARALSFSDLSAALRAGWSDFRRAPLIGAGFGAAYAAAGLALLWLGAGMFSWTLALTLGFPLVAPFAAVGLYETSRRIEAGEPIDVPEILGVVAAERNRQMPWLGGVMLLTFLFWSFFAHMLFAGFFGASAILNVHSSLEMFLTPRGYAMMAAQAAVGGAVALLIFSLVAFGMPMLLDREIDFVTAMITSLRAVRENAGVMLVWAAMIAAITFAAMLPALLGLVVALPVLGHATWHLYRRAFRPTAT